MGEIRILIVEDEPLIAEDIRDHLTDINYRAVDVAYTKEQAIRYLDQYDLDAVLLDINLGNQTDGIEIATVINSKYRLPFVFLTSYSDKETLDQAKLTRPWGYVVKPFDEKDLFTSLELAIYNFAQAQKPKVLDRDVLNGRLDQPLTTKEFEIILDLFTGATNKQLAERHYVSVNTVKTHLKNIYDKLNVKTRTAVISLIQNVTIE